MAGVDATSQSWDEDSVDQRLAIGDICRQAVEFADDQHRCGNFLEGEWVGGSR